jgi:DNA mismatch repair ATPase MutS
VCVLRGGWYGLLVYVLPVTTGVLAVKILRMRVNVTPAGGIVPLYSVEHGMCTQDSYGIRLAKTAGFPPAVLEEAVKVRRVLSESKQSQLSRQELSVIQLGQRLEMLSRATIPPDAIREYLRTLQQRYLKQ